jgi:hypothetical protein
MVVARGSGAGRRAAGAQVFRLLSPLISRENVADGYAKSEHTAFHLPALGSVGLPPGCQVPLSAQTRH